MAPAEPNPSPPLTLRTLGVVGLYAAETAQPILGPGKPLALVIYLALTPGRRSSREFLLDLLWADLDPERARRALRQTLFHLRRLLGDETLAGSEELTLSEAIEVDRDRFLRALEQGEPDTAVTLYGGNFLPEFGVPGGAAFEHWADLERDRLQTAFLRSTEMLVRRQLNASHAKEAQRLARRARDLVANDEGAWRLVLEAAIAANDHVAAAVEAEALDRWVAQEGITLEPLTHLVVARARGLTPSQVDDASDRGLVAELTGREREFSAITSAWEAARTGRARHLHLSAAAGFGKSRLLRDATSRLQAAGACIARVHGTPGDRDVPYAFAADLASAIAALPGAAGVAPASAATLVALNPALSNRFVVPPDPAQGEEALRRRIHALADLVQSVGHEQPFVLAIDDLHWIDRFSYRILEGVFSRLEGTPVLCLTAARPERQPLSERCTVLPLSPLTRDQIASLVSALATLPPQHDWSVEFIVGLHRATSGSPLLILETLRLAIDQGILSVEDQEWRCHKADRLRALLQTGQALRERLRSLPAEQGWLLALLGTAGTLLDAGALATAAAIPPEEIAEALATLEHQGLVVQAGTGWSTSHDEIAAASADSLTSAQRIAAHRAIGHHFRSVAGSDSDGLLRAARHLMSGQDEAAIPPLYRRYAELARRRGDGRPFAELAAELVGEDSSSSRVHLLVGRLPLPWRFGLWSALRQAAAATMLLVLPVLLVVARFVRQHDEAALERLVYVDSTDATTGVVLRTAEWNGTSTPLTPARMTSTMGSAARTYTGLPPAISPDGRAVAWIRDSGDSTTLDIWLHSPAGTKRLTNQVRDDLVQGWLPDGSALIGQTNRWSPRGNADYDIAVFDTATGSARQVTRGPAQDITPFVSPDGTRVAFVRSSQVDPPELCITAIDGLREPTCRLIGGQSILVLLGWTGLDELALTTNESGAQPLVLYDWLRDTRTTILGPYASRPRLSPDRRWAAVSARIAGVTGFRDMVVPLAAPDKARSVTGLGQTRDAVRWWEGPPDNSWLIARLEFRDTVSTVLPGIGTRLTVRPVTAAGTEVPIRAPIRWSSSDSAVATIDSAGDVHVHSAGDFTVTASLVGWRTAHKRIRVESRMPSTVFAETWDTTWMHRWLPWGDPRPTVSTGAGGVRGLWNHGDGVYPSMAISRDSFSIRNGLGLEMRISTPLTYAQHQRLKLLFVAGIDLPRLMQADQHRSPPTAGASESMCGIVFPEDGGRWGATRAGLFGGISEMVDLGAAATRMRSGAWWTLRIQILPDGRCGVAVNNRVLRLSMEPIPLEPTYHLWLGDESDGVKLLHGPMQVWTGVRTDIRWDGSNQ